MRRASKDKITFIFSRYDVYLSLVCKYVNKTHSTAEVVGDVTIVLLVLCHKLKYDGISWQSTQ